MPPQSPSSSEFILVKSVFLEGFVNYGGSLTDGGSYSDILNATLVGCKHSAILERFGSPRFCS